MKIIEDFVSTNTVESTTVEPIISQNDIITQAHDGCQ